MDKLTHSFGIPIIEEVIDQLLTISMNCNLLIQEKK
uniref:Uncharacterized protein n=1 Tax=Meloidogyne hapla TaxID=6305 RepID=A0A1I8BXE3_MELHA